jgi:hypothetical protein
MPRGPQTECDRAANERKVIPVTAARLEQLSVPEPNTGCWLWTGSSSSTGYGKLSSAGKTLAAHRAAHEIFVGEIPRGMCVCHHCDTPACINPAHLFLGTYSDNAIDRLRKARFVKLSPGDVLAICASQESIPSLAARYGVGEDHIGKVLRGEAWGCISRAARRQKMAKRDAARVHAEADALGLRRRLVMQRLHRGDPDPYRPAPRDARRSRAKLTEEAVRVIRTDTTSLERELAQRFGVTPGAIGSVRRGINWRHVK